MKESYRLDELAEIWETSEKVLRLMIRQGKLSGFKVGATWRVTCAERVRYENKGPLIADSALCDHKGL